MTFADPVSLVRAAIDGSTGLETARVLDAAFTSGPMPVVHVHHLSGTADEVDRLDQVGVDVYHPPPPGRAHRPPCSWRPGYGTPWWAPAAPRLWG